MAKKDPSSMSPLDRAKAKFKKMQKQKEERAAGGGGGQKYLQLADGKNIVRILPAKSELEDIITETAMHYNVGPAKKVVKCPAYIGKECPICARGEELKKEAWTLANKVKRSGGDSKKDPKVTKAFERARAFAPRPRFFANAIPLQLGSEKFDGKLVQVFGMPQTIADAILSIVTDMEEFGNVLDLKKGRDFIIKKSGDGLNTRYEVSLRDADRSNPVHSNRLKDLHDLAEEAGGFPTTKEVRAILEGDSSDASDDDEDEEDDKPSSKRKKASRFKDDEDEDEEDEEESSTSKKKKKAKASRDEDDEEDEDDADDEDEDDESSDDDDDADSDDDDEDDDDEDEEEESPKKKKLKTKLKKMSGRK